MATLKPTVKSKLKTRMYIVYIRVVHNRQSSFIRTSWMVNDKGIKGKDVIDPYVIQQTSNLISRYYSALNQINTSNWTASEVVAYLRPQQKICRFQIMQESVCAIEDTGFSNVDQIMDKLVTMLPKKTKNARVQFKITNVDKNLTQMYQRLVR